jgi:hypothetical protein
MVFINVHEAPHIKLNAREKTLGAGEKLEDF